MGIIIVAGELTPELVEMLDELFTDDHHELDGMDGDYDGWYCLQIKPTKCPCGYVMCYAEPDVYHNIIVWEEKDDEALLRVAMWFQELDAEPYVMQYNAFLGECITWKEADKRGLVRGYERKVS